MIYSLIIWVLNLGGGSFRVERSLNYKYSEDKFSRNLVKELKDKTSRGYEILTSIVNFQQTTSIINTCRLLIYNQEKMRLELDHLKGTLDSLAPPAFTENTDINYELHNISGRLINKPFIYVKSIIEFYIKDSIIVKLQYGEKITVQADSLRNHIELIVDSNDNVIQIQNSL